MPIDNAAFVPPVVCNSYHNRQIAEWIAGRPVPTMEEMGAKRPVGRPMPPVVTTQGQPHSPLAALDSVVVEPGRGDGSTITVRLQTPNSMADRTNRQKAIFSNPAIDAPNPTTNPIREIIPVRPINDPSVIPVARPRPIIGTPKPILPPTKKRS